MPIPPPPGWSGPSPPVAPPSWTEAANNGVSKKRPPPPPGFSKQAPPPPPPGAGSAVPPPPGSPSQRLPPPPPETPGPPEAAKNPGIDEEKLKSLQQKWKLGQDQRYRRRQTKKRKAAQLPPEHLRQIVKGLGYANAGPAQADKRSYLGALKFLPYAMMKLLENMPQPWEAEKKVPVTYHISGALTIVDQVPFVNEPQFRAQWAAAWALMRREKRDRRHFRRMRFPAFEDEEPPLDWKENFVGVDVPDSVCDDDNYVGAKSLFDEKEQRGKTWTLDLPTQALYHSVSKPLLLHNDDYLFDEQSLETAKALNVALPGGPKFEPLYEPDSDDISEFNAPDRIIFRQPLKTEYQIAFPHLYNSRPRKVCLSKYQSPLNVSTGANFELAPGVNKIPRRPRKMDPTLFEPLDEPVEPLFSDIPLSTSGIDLLQAPYPFNSRQGRRVRAQDVAMIKGWYQGRPPRQLPVKVRVSHQRLRKQQVLLQLHRKSPPDGPRHLLRHLKQTKYFKQTEIDWLEAGLQLCRQGFTILQLLIHRRGLTFLHLDYNFNLKPTKTLTTKERKRSRFGHSFHLVRELLKIVKLVVDAHVMFRLGQVDAYELADGLHYIFTHVGQLTGLYRYKYKVMHQIRACKDLKHLIHAKFNADGVGKGPGCGVWQPAWRVWLAWLRGTLPLLERWLGNLLARQFEGRLSKGVTKTVTKQRVDSHYDLELRASVLHDILDMMPEGIRQNKTKTILQHLSEAWRCWKANIPWHVPGLPKPIEAIILRYIKAKADHWVQVAQFNRERISKGATVDKSVAKKNLGRLARLWFKAEQERQTRYVADGPYISPTDAEKMFKTLIHWLDQREFERIPFPPPGYKHDTKLLVLALEHLRSAYSLSARLNQSQREELALIEQAYDNPHECLTRIKRALATQRVFKEVQVDLMDMYSHTQPVYTVDPQEKIIDAYLDHYLWFEADRRRLFPNWIKPSDGEIAPVLVHSWSQGVSHLTQNTYGAVHVQFQLKDMVEKIDLLLLNKLLRLIVDANIADYITAKMNVVLAFKDMSMINRYGVLRGIQFAPFVIQYYGLMIDLLLLGLPRAHEIAGAQRVPNRFMSFSSKSVETDHPVRAYCRYFDQVHMLFVFDEEESDDIVTALLNVQQHVYNMADFPTPKSWPRDLRMKLVRQDVNLGRAVMWNIENRLPPAIVSAESFLVSVKSPENPALLFSMLGFDLRIAPRGVAGPGAGQDAVWPLVDPQTQERIAYAQVRVSLSEVNRFNNRIRQILMTSGSTTFSKVIDKWNTALIAFVSYFREASIATPELLDVLVRCETRIQTRVKLGLNSKMPSRFPPCVFYSPKELGGLGMLSASHILIPASDLRWSQQTSTGITHFRAGMQHDEEAPVPNIFRYLPSWQSELVDSQRVWAEYAQKRQEAQESNRRIQLEDLEDSWDRGLPRINTLFQKDRHTLAYDKGHRPRSAFRKFWLDKYHPFWWTNQRHDGKLWNLNAYRADVIQALGGIETILEHTLFKATGFDSWEGLFWERQSGFEDSMRFKKLTNAQRSGLSQIPNRRFTLWWSPTINRANVYAGFMVQLDLTGIFLHGKIPTLKISLIQIFRAHLWQKIHESLVMDLCQVLDREMDSLQIDAVTKQPIHPRKSYKMSSSTADVVLTSAYRWNVSRPSLLNEKRDQMDLTTSTKYWIDVQLRYGDYDSHDTTRYTRAKFLDYTSDGVSQYPSATGLMICIDLAYNTYDAYGNWIPGLKPLMQQALAKIVQVNPALYVLRERIRKGLQLYQAQPQQSFLNSSNYSDMFAKTQFFVDDTVVYRAYTYQTTEGNLSTRPINGAVQIINPRTGQLFLKIVPASTWAGQKRLGALAKWKTAEEVGALLRSLPKDELPSQLVITSKGLLDPLEVHMLDFPNVAVRPSELNLPFRATLALPQISELVGKATEPKMVLFNLYDDWLTKTSAHTAFSRLILLLRGLHLHPERAKAILRPNSNAITQPHHLWPTLTTEQWMKVENDMSDLILNDYGRKNNVNVQALTQSEIRDLILGQPIKAPSQERQAQIDGTENGQQAAQQTALKTVGQNVHGDEMVVVTTSQYEQQTFLSRTDWRTRAIATTQLYSRVKNLFVEQGDLDDEKRTFVFPRNVLRQFIMAADLRTQVAAFLYACPAKGNDLVYEVRMIAFVPQLGGSTSVSLPQRKPEIDDEELELVGMLILQPIETELTASSLATYSRYFGANDLLTIASFTPGSVTLHPYNPTAEAVAWGKQFPEPAAADLSTFQQSMAESGQIVLTDRFQGGFYVPQDKMWNFAFLGAAWSEKMRYHLQVGVPLSFYDQLHRPVHFTTFSSLEDVDVEDVFS